MARFVPERLDDFILENNLICGRFYGEAIEGDPTSPGFDIWVKTAGPLVADQRYKDELENGRSYHLDWGNGKDCYKVGVSLGAGASVPMVDGALCYPPTNYRAYEMVENGPEKVVFNLYYPDWKLDENTTVALTKTITIVPDTYFFKTEDTYFGDFESLTVAAGIWDHGHESAEILDDRFAIWEAASDQSAEPEDGMIGVGIVCPGAESIVTIEGEKTHLVATKTLKPGETLTYWFGSCWSKADVKTAEAWFKTVRDL